MKYLELTNLLELTNFMTNKEVGLCIINGKIEAFSLMKRAPSQLLSNSSSSSGSLSALRDTNATTIASVPSSSSFSSSTAVGIGRGEVVGSKKPRISKSSSSLSKPFVSITQPLPPRPPQRKAPIPANTDHSSSRTITAAPTTMTSATIIHEAEVASTGISLLPAPLSVAAVAAASLPTVKTEPTSSKVEKVDKPLSATYHTHAIGQRPRAHSVAGLHGFIGKPVRRRATSLGDLKEPSSKKLLIDLISTLDEFFPDYDFESTKPEQFLIKDVNQVIQRVNESLAELTQERSTFLEKLWRGIDEVVNLRSCDVFSLVPDMAEDPFSDGTLWSFNYFFFNYELKQLVYFTCVAKSKFFRDDLMDVSRFDEDDDEDDEDEQDDDNNSDDDVLLGTRRQMFGSNTRMLLDDAGDDDTLDGEGSEDARDWDGII